MGIENFFGNTYKLSSSDNFEAYLTAMGVSDSIIPIILNSKPEVTLSEGDDGSYKWSTVAPEHTKEESFKPGEEFELTGMDGRKHSGVVTIDGNKMITEIISDPSSTVVADFSDSKLAITLTTGSVSANQVFSRI